MSGTSTSAGAIGVLASGSGSNLQALIDSDLGAPIAVVIVNVPGAKALDRAAKAGIPAVLLDHKQFGDRGAFDRALVDTLVQHGVTWVVLAGFMRIITRVVLDAFPDRVVNIHPALLPAFPGVHAQGQALRAGVKIAGCTVHLVDEGTDTGPILAQAAVPVFADDDEVKLSQRILAEEHKLFPAVVRALAAGKLRVTIGEDGKKRATLDGAPAASPGALVSPRVHGGGPW